MNDPLQKFVESSGALAETLKISYDSFVSAGFSEKEAMVLTKEYLSTTLYLANLRDNGSAETP